MPMLSRYVVPLLALLILVLFPPDTLPAGEDYQPQIAGASNEGTLAIQGFKIPQGMVANLVAAEPKLANPVAFCIDAQGRFYICETFRQQKGVEDNRNHMTWLHDDLAARTVEDRLAYFKKHLQNKVSDYAVEHDRIRLLEDTNGDGVVDKAGVFADGFHNILDGTGAGVLANGSDVYYTCIPDLWMLKDTNHDGKADAKKSLAYGFGVRVAFRGHDMHGLTIGPDGRLYFSIGDRGLNVKTKEGRHLVYPDTGCVLRCELDGTNLEVFASGLRNPQELAFDDLGNLFTGDNNSDSGDKARFVYVVNGGDSGWRMYYQYLEDRGPFNRERIWYPYQSDEETTAVQPAYIVPPIANIADGPSGLAYYPGLGLPDRYQNHFFLCDFRGNAGNSGIRSFAVKPNGASFELVDSHEFLWSILATDADFGYDGGLYATDWVEGWDGPGKGRLYRFSDPQGAKAVVAANTQALMKAGFDHSDVKELVQLLEHPDKRIRQEAQFALVRKNAVEELLGLAKGSGKPLPRMHAIWGIGQLIRQGSFDLADELSLLLAKPDLDSEVLAQTAKVFGDCVRIEQDSFRDCLQTGGRVRMQRLLDHPKPRVRFFAALGMANIGGVDDLLPLLTLLDENQDRDPMLRHAAVMGLVGIGKRNPQELEQWAAHSSRYGRLGVLLAMRRLRSPKLASFLNDAEPDLVLEAARAINDLPIQAAKPSLAKLADRPGMADPLLRRVINANARLGFQYCVENLAKLAANDAVPEPLRLQAIAGLQEWDKPSPLDPVTGDWQPITRTATGSLADLIRPHLGGLFSGSDNIRRAAAKLAAKHGIKEVVPVLVELVSNTNRAVATRVAALGALADLKSEQLPQVIEESLSANVPSLRAEARRLLAIQNPDKAIRALKAAIESGETIERQSALSVLASINNPETDTILSGWLDRLLKNQAPLEIQLDILEAARLRGTNELVNQIKSYEAGLLANDPLAPYQVALAGGDADRGREIFFGRSAVSCRRCHLIDGSGGEVGPDLSDIGLKQKRNYLLEAIVDPNKQIAKGFESVQVATSEGEVILGVFKSEDDKTLRLMNKDGGIIIISKDDIDDRAVGKSAMPGDLVKQLTKSDVRDLVEYLSTLKTPPVKANLEHKE